MHTRKSQSEPVLCRAWTELSLVMLWTVLVPAEPSACLGQRQHPNISFLMTDPCCDPSEQRPCPSDEIRTTLRSETRTVWTSSEPASVTASKPLLHLSLRERCSPSQSFICMRHWLRLTHTHTHTAVSDRHSHLEV